MEKSIVKVNVCELASELADRDLKVNWGESIRVYEDEDADILTYTDEAQDIFNDLYDLYYDLILSAEVTE